MSARLLPLLIIATVGLLPESASAAIWDDFSPLYEVIKNPENLKIWELARNLVNWVLFAGLLVVAFSSILPFEIDTYSVKKTLPSLLLGFVLANFSLLICEVVIQLGDSLALTTQEFGGVEALFGKQWSIIITGGILGLISAGIFGGPIGIVLGLVVVIVLLFFPIIALLLLGLIFIVRYYVVQFLVAVSPLAFMAMGLPLTQKLFGTWWKQLSLWVFLKPIGFFFLALGGIVLESGIGGIIVGYVVGIGCMIAAIIFPFQAGGIINSTLAKYGGGLIKNRAGSAFNKAMSNDKFAKSGFGRFTSKLAGGYEAFKEREASRARTAKANVVGEATTSLRTRDQMKEKRDRLLRKGNFKRFFQSYTPNNAEARFKALKMSEDYSGRDAARAIAESEVEKTLPKDVDKLMDRFHTATDPVEKAVIYRKVTELGKLSTLVGQINRQSEELGKDPTSVEAKMFEEQHGFKAGEQIDYQNSDQMLRLTTALHSGDALLNLDLAETKNLHVVNKNNQKYQETIRMVGEWANTAYKAGDHHLGVVLDDKKAGALSQLLLDKVEKGQLVKGEKLRNKKIAAKLFTGEPQEIARRLSHWVMVDEKNNLTQFARDVLDEASPTIIGEHKNRVEDKIRTAADADTSSQAAHYQAILGRKAPSTQQQQPRGLLSGRRQAQQPPPP